jgi:putative transposase
MSVVNRGDGIMKTTSNMHSIFSHVAEDIQQQARFASEPALLPSRYSILVSRSTSRVFRQSRPETTRELHGLSEKLRLFKVPRERCLTLYGFILHDVLMANKHAFKSNSNIVYSCKYHVVWTPKYRRKVLVRGVDVRLKEIIHEVATELQCEVLELEVMPDHVHMFCEVDPQFGIHRFVKRVKGRSSRILRQEFDWITTQRWSIVMVGKKR